jgi:hypothetical protein
MTTGSIFISGIIAYRFQRALSGTAVALLCAALSLGAMTGGASAEQPKVKLEPAGKEAWNSKDPKWDGTPTTSKLPFKDYWEYSKTSWAADEMLKKPCFTAAERAEVLRDVQAGIEKLLQFKTWAAGGAGSQEAGDYASQLNAKHLQLHKVPLCTTTATPGAPVGPGTGASGSGDTGKKDGPICWSKTADEALVQEIAANEDLLKKQREQYDRLKDEQISLYEKLNPGLTADKKTGVVQKKLSGTLQDAKNQKLLLDPKVKATWEADYTNVGAHLEQVETDIDNLKQKLGQLKVQLEKLRKTKCPETGKTSDNDKKTPNSPGKTTSVDVPGKTPTTDTPGKTPTTNTPPKTPSTGTPGKTPTTEVPGKTPTTDSPGKTVDTDKTQLKPPVKKGPGKTAKRLDPDKQTGDESRQPTDQSTAASRERDRAALETFGTAVTIGVGIGTAFGGRGHGHGGHHGGRGEMHGGGMGMGGGMGFGR